MVGNNDCGISKFEKFYQGIFDKLDDQKGGNVPQGTPDSNVLKLVYNPTSEKDLELIDGENWKALVPEAAYAGGDLDGKNFEDVES